MRTFTALIVATLLAVVPAGVAGQPVEKLIQHVPDNAGLAIVTHDLGKVVAGARDFAKAIGIPDDDTEDINADEMLGELPGGAKFFDASNAFVAALVPEEEDMLVITTLKDVDGWKKDTGATEGEDGLFTIDQNYSTIKVAIKGDIIIIGSEQEAVLAATKSTGKFAAGFEKDAAKIAKDNGFAIYIQVAPWEEMLDEGFQGLQMMAQMGMMMAGQNSPLSAGMMKFAIDDLRDFVEDVDASVVGVKLGADGIAAHFGILLDPTSGCAKYLGQIDRPKKDILRGLPNAPTPMVFAYEWVLPPQAESLFDQLFNALDASLPTDDPETTETANARKAFALMKKMNRMVSGANGVLLDSPDHRLAVVGSYLCDKPTDVRDATLECMKPELMSAYMGLWMAGCTMDMATSQETISGKPVDVIQMSFNSENEEMAAMMQAIYGQNTTMFLTPSSSGLYYCTAAADFGRQQCANMLDGKAGAFSAGPAAKAVFADLPPNPQFCILVDPAHMMRFGYAMAEGLGAGLPDVDLPEVEQRYAALAMYLDGREINTELRVPAHAVKP
ncbi:MAG: hypothetical protein JXO22_03980, partial [Phycisphaerae bacterium]|nr:hypothetical protein [Phycisphaerae bacterium]